MNSRVLGLIAAGCVLSACREIDVTKDASIPASAPVTAGVDTEIPAQLPVPPVDAATAKSAWNEGVVAFEAGGFAEAARKLEVAVSGRPQDPQASYLLGLSYWKNGELESAERALECSLSLDATRR